MVAFKEFFKNISGIVARMSPSQVMMLLGVTAGTLVGVVLLYGWLTDITYSRLYSDLDESEAGEVIAYLNDNRIPYKLSNGGTVIEVPSGDVYKARISLATEGLPRSANVGYSIFDQSNLGMTDFLQNLNFRRALEGELTRTIMQLHEVDAARVHIVMPKDRLFKEDQNEATASVVVKLKQAGSLAKQQVAGISHLMASSVEGLKPENITILDYDGNLLSSGQKNDVVAGLTSSQLEVGMIVEKRLENKAQSMLDEVLGVGASVVRVSAQLDFQQLESTSEKYDPNASSIRSEERSTLKGSNSEKTAENNETNEEENTEKVITNYELNKTVEHMINAVGTIKRLSVAILLDGTYTSVENEAGELESVYQPRSPEELNRFESIVKNAVGYDAERDDQIEIVNIAFDHQNLEGDRNLLDAMYTREYIMEIARKVGYVALFVFLFFYLKKKARKLFASMAKLIPPQRPKRPEPIVEEEPEPMIVPEKRKPRLVDKMQETAKEQPEEIARVIKTMMVD